METKICLKCTIKKTIESFRLKKDKNGKFYRYSYCKECEKIIRKKTHKIYYSKNKDEIKKYLKEYYQENKLARLNHQKEYYQNHKEEKSNYDKLRRKKQEIKERRNLQEKYNYDNDDVFKLKKTLRNNLYKFFKGKKYTKKSKMYHILGCDYITFINHLYNSFEKRYGYKYDNQIEINIDHIIPLDIAKNEEEIIILNHYTNLQLLTKKDNLLKGKKIIGG